MLSLSLMIPLNSILLDSLFCCFKWFPYPFATTTSGRINGMFSDKTFFDEDWPKFRQCVGAYFCKLYIVT